jgi:hypothetical protein
MNEVEQERERCNQRRLELGPREFQRLWDLWDEAQELCYSLCVLRKRTPRVERLLRMAENRRERRNQAIWPWVSFERWPVE